jgi:phosphinothricin acetyltransferase
MAGERATIRLATAEDAQAIAAIYAPFCESSIVSFEEAAPSAEEMAGRIAKITAQYPWLVLDDGAVAGYAYASPHRERAAYRWAVDVTVYVHAEYRRRGVGSAVYTALFAVLARQGYHRAFGGVALPNPGSEGLHEALGFAEVGVYRQVGWKFGAWRDVRWYQRPLRDGAPGPAAPVREVLGSPAWDEAVAAGLALYRASGPTSPKR